MPEIRLSHCSQCQQVTAWTVYPPKKKDIQREVCNKCGNQQLRRFGIERMVLNDAEKV